MKYARVKYLAKALITGGFWFWNIAFMIAVGFGFLPFVAVGIFSEFGNGTISFDFVFFCTVVLLLGPFSAYFAYKYCPTPSAIAKFFYGVEAPIFFLSVARVFLLREMTLATTHLAIAIVVALVTFAFCLSKKESILKAKNWLRWLHVVGVSFGFFVAVYFGLLLLFYAPPTVFWLGKGTMHVLSNLFDVLSNGTFLVFLLYIFVYGGFIFITGLAFFAVFPFFLVTYYGQNFFEMLRAMRNRSARVLAFGTILANILVFVFASTQPQQEILALDPENLSQEDISWIVANESNVKSGIMNAYLSPYRYLGLNHGRGHIQEMYESVFWRDSPIAESLQGTFNFLAAPFLYDGHSMAKDQRKAEKLYEIVFDQQIQKGENTAVNLAINANYNRDQAEASLLDAGNEDVLLIKQDVSVIEKNGYAEVELAEVYENLTSENKEILYYFSLPNTATLTGVWLSQDGDKEKMFAYTVAPRGAAQQVYNSEVRRSVDPALLEQVGPESYRLRVFPIEGRRLITEVAKPTRLWIKYVTLPEDEGMWSRPLLLEKRNIFWNSKSEFWLNGVAVQRESEDWFPPLPRAEKDIHALSAPIGDGLFVTVKKHKADLLQDARVAVLIDTSGSMRAERQLHDYLTKQHTGFLAHDAIVHYFVDGESPVSRSENIPENLVFFGKKSRAELLSWFADHVGNESYDAIIVVSDSKDEPDTSWNTKDLVLPGPTWLVFVDGKQPTFFDDGLMRSIIRSGGGSETDLSQIVERSLAVDTMPVFSQHEVDVVDYNDGYLWTVSDQVPSSAHRVGETEGFHQLAAARFISYKSQLLDMDDRHSLDSLHSLAQSHSVVTPWSSMIVLVNDRQRQALAEANTKSDAFDRETESGKQLMSSPPNNFAVVPGTPEPEEWALIIAALALLLYEWRRRGGSVSWRAIPF